MPSLFVIRGRDQGTRFDLNDETILVGREASNTIHLQDTEASRRHAELRLHEGIYTLTDLNSSNGTFVNGRRIESRELASGDRVQLGKSLLLYTAASDRSADDLSHEIDIISQSDSGDGSRILHSMSQQDGSAIFDMGVESSQSPWLARARSNLQIMYRTALAVSHTLDIDELLNRIMEMIFEWVEADRGCIMLFDPETRKLVPKVHRQRKPTAGQIGKDEAVERMQISRTILDYVSEKNEGVLTSNAKDDDRWDTGKSILQMGVREAICVPMQGRYDVVGVIYIDTSISPQKMLLQAGASNKFTEEHLKLMIAIAHQAALAVEDTSYYTAMVQAERLAAVGQTVATLSHHVKNVLQGISSGSYLIELGMSDHRKAAVDSEVDAKKLAGAVEMIEKGWRIVEKNQGKISTLVLDMLTFSKERDPEPAPAEINEIVTEVVELMQQLADDLGVKIDLNLADDIPTLMFDPEGLHRAVLNLVTNSIDACDVNDDHVVRISTQLDREAEMLRVTVEDNGTGISTEDLDQIFKLFVSHKGRRGTGLGLPVTQKIIQEHGGDVHVESTLGVGSRFVLEWPAVYPGEEPNDDDSAVRHDTVSWESLREELDREQENASLNEEDAD